MGFMHKLGLRSAGDYADLQLKLDNESAETKRLRGLLADRDEYVSKLLGARRIDGETVTQMEGKIAGLKRDLTAANDKFKAAVKDMEAQAREIAVLKDAVEQAEAQADILRPDAEAMRAKRQRDRDLKAGKKAQTAVATPKKGASK